MKYIIGFIVGILTILLVNLVFLSPTNERELAIIVHIINDTDIPFKVSTVKTDNERVFSCTIENGKCSVAIIGSGDIGFVILANDVLGRSYISRGTHSFYAETGTTHTIKLSSLRENT